MQFQNIQRNNNRLSVIFTSVVGLMLFFFNFQKINVCIELLFRTSGPCGLAGFTQGGGYCYKVSADGDRQDFRTAETECKKYKEGHLAAFHSTEEYDTIDNLAK